ncbi:fimbrial protein [Stenotrophomonas sp. UBA7606]|uniref:fimbrial protein n=1 Tax=Stenotrophomonas sp. UBA7606 TaxID=1947559 RepID=UPI0025EE1784|nr:fimbrial protein [Stenotrophomonas sp. UBA7606]
MSVIHPRGRLLVAAVLAVLGTACFQHASANCVLNPFVSFSAQNIDVDLGEISVPSSLPVGGVFLTRSYNINQKSSTTFLCDLWGPNSSSLVTYQASFNGYVSGVPGGLITAVPGIGIRITQTATDYRGILGSFHYTGDIDYRLGQALGVPASNVVIELIKTSTTVGSGKIGSDGLFAAQLMNNARIPMVTLNLRNGGAIIKPPTCEVSAGSKNIAVNFGPVASAAFSGVGAIAANRDFDIALDCQSSNVANATVGIRVDALQDASNFAGALPLAAAADAASGIAIQMVRRESQGEQPVRFGENIVLVTGAMNAGRLVLPLRARYIQTRAGTVLPGKAAGSATFTIQYN